MAAYLHFDGVTWCFNSTRIYNSINIALIRTYRGVVRSQLWRKRRMKQQPISSTDANSICLDKRAPLQFYFPPTSLFRSPSSILKIPRHIMIIQSGPKPRNCSSRLCAIKGCWKINRPVSLNRVFIEGEIFPCSHLFPFKMTRLTVTVVTMLLIYLAYHALAIEAVPNGNPKSLNSGGDSDENGENLLSDANLGKLQTAWLKSALKRRVLTAGSGTEGHAGSYSALRRSLTALLGNNAKIPLGYLAELSLLDDEDIQKRFDDYGHMRFGKRGGEGDQFDDYGHMRFGR